MLFEGHNPDLQEQIPSDVAIIEQCQVSALRTWDIIEGPKGKPNPLLR